MNIKSILELANKEFVDHKIDNYFYEARELMVFTLGKTKEWIMSNTDYELSDKEYKDFLKVKERRIHGEPLQYILGEQYFMGLKFTVNSDVLIPRADTEILVYKVIELLTDKENVKILDVCTGSGCISVSLAKNIKNAKIYASDVSAKAINVAEKNAEINEAEVKFFISDLFSEIPEEKFDIIVSNPPYINAEDMKTLSKEVLNEPHLALYGGKDGLDFYKKISKTSLEYLKDDGILVFEIGYNQANDVSDILKNFGYSKVEIIKDYSNNDRVLVAYR